MPLSINEGNKLISLLGVATSDMSTEYTAYKEHTIGQVEFIEDSGILKIRHVRAGEADKAIILELFNKLPTLRLFGIYGLFKTEVETISLSVTQVNKLIFLLECGIKKSRGLG